MLREPDLDRRRFLQLGAALGARAAVSPASPVVATERASVRRKVRLGRTGLEISDVSFGSSRLRGDESLVHDAFERGVNYFDTAESYGFGKSEETLGRALEGKRDQVILATKTMSRKRTALEDLMESLEGSLRRLRTDRVEIYFNHAVNAVSRLENDAWYEFAERAKEQGKIRYTGISGHGGKLSECVDYALEHDAVDVMLLAYNFGQDPSFYERFTRTFDFVATQHELPPRLERAKQKDVGIVAMKTLMGARLNDLRPYETGEATFAQAAFRWVLSGGMADALIVSMKSHEQIEEYLGASGWTKPHVADQALLERYLARNGTISCRQGCSACAGACPAGVEIGEVLRTRMYARDYEDLELARGDYAGIERDASACASCSAPCLDACPHGIAIGELTRDTHSWLA